MVQIELLDSKGNPIKEPKEPLKWIPYHEYLCEQYHRGKCTPEEYIKALENFIFHQNKE